MKTSGKQQQQQQRKKKKKTDLNFQSSPTDRPRLNSKHSRGDKLFQV
jgi:hypothetical protein